MVVIDSHLKPFAGRDPISDTLTVALPCGGDSGSRSSLRNLSKSVVSWLHGFHLEATTFWRSLSMAAVDGQ